MGDLDNDGDMDIATGSHSTTNELYVWENTLIHRNMPFGSGTDIPASSDDSRAVVAGDLDQDGDLDIIIGRDSAVDTVWLGDGDGTFTQVGSPGWSSSTDTRALALGDLNGDGNLDLVMGITGAADQVWTGDGDGTFTQVGSPGWSGSTNTRALALGDLNGDGDLDLVVGITGAADTVWKGDGDGTFTQVGSPGWASANTEALALGDLDGNGKLDLIMGIDAATDQVWEGDGDATFTQQGSPGWGSVNTRSLVLGDLNNDGDLDLVVGIDSAADAVWTGDGDGTFTTVASPGWSGATSTRSLVLGDLDLDGDLDLIVGITGSADTAWSGDGDGTFTQVTMSGWASANTDAAVLGDFDNDGDQDLVSVYSSGIDEFFRNSGGSVGYTVTDSDPGEMGNSDEDDVLIIKVEHNGIPDDNDLEVEKWSFLFEETDGDPLTTAEAQSIFNNLYVYVDDGDNNYDAGDTLSFTIASASISLSSGVQEFDFAEGSNFQISQATGSKTYLLVIEMKSDAEDSGIGTFRVTFDPDADSLNEDRTEDTSVSVADSSETNTGNVPIPEFPSLAVPVVGVAGLFAIFRWKRKQR